MNVLGGLQAVFNATRHHEHVAWVQDNVAIAKLNGQLPTDDHEELVRFRVSVPDELTLELDHFYVVVVDARQSVRLLLLGDRGKSVLSVADIVCQTPNAVGAALSDTL